MSRLLQPKTFFLGATEADREGLRSYLAATDQLDFLESFDASVARGMSSGEALCSFYAKLCYKSLVRGKNANVARIRDIPANLENAHDVGHGSVFEHCMLNFVVTDCSRVFTHELVRHRIGTAFSQTSGRFCRLDKIDLVWDMILDGCEDLAFKLLKEIEDTIYQMECRKGLRRPNPAYPDARPEDCLDPAAVSRALGGRPLDNWEATAELIRWVPDDSLAFDFRKKVTSAIRRIAPNGQPNEIGFSVNIRALRQLIQVRTSPQAEREIRLVFNQVYDLVRPRFPTIFHGARTRTVDGLRAVYGMKTQPYELVPGDKAALEFFTAAELRAAAAKKEAA